MWKIRSWILCCMLFGVKIPEARLQTCDGMPTRIVERLHHLDQVYPEWKLPEGTYCMEWEGNSAFWTFRGSQEVFYSEPMLWEGELSAALAKGLCSLGRKVRQETQEKKEQLL